MIETLKSDEVAKMVGGRFKLAAIVQRRWAQIMDGARPMVDRHGRTELEIVIEEIRQGKLAVEKAVEEPAEE